MALAPAQVLDVIINEEAETPTCRVIVPSNQLSLAIGNKGQNARLAAGLTGFKIDIISDVQAKELDEQEETEETAAPVAEAAVEEAAAETPAETAEETAAEGEE